MALLDSPPDDRLKPADDSRFPLAVARMPQAAKRGQDETAAEAGTP